jgi:hypothetical protein
MPFSCTQLAFFLALSAFVSSEHNSSFLVPVGGRFALTYTYLRKKLLGKAGKCKAR